ncbi:MAG: IclR family transcriptional regulator [Clostridiales bacterium]|nr:IclR family transcriptional regulator [Clostridiales bacterium]
MEKKSRPIIQSIQRAVEILNCFTEESPKLTLMQISQQTGLNINTARGLVNTMVYYDLISHNTTSNTYSLGLYFVIKSNLVYETRKLGSFGDIARPYMREITDRYGIFSSLQVVSQSKIFMIETAQPMQIHYWIMAQLYEPFECYCTSSGKLYLQYLPPEELKERLSQMTFVPHTPNTITSREALLEVLHDQEYTLYATEYDEMAIGISSIAAPSLRQARPLFGTISVTAPIQILRENHEQISGDLLSAGRKIASQVSMSSELMMG